MTDMIAEMRAILDKMPQPMIICHPDHEEQMRAALARLPFPTPVPELVTNPWLPDGQAIYIPDARRLNLDLPPTAARGGTGGSDE